MPLLPTPHSPAAIAACAAVLRDGHTVILPTDTVYGIAADALNEAAVQTIYEAKGKAGAAPLQLLFSPDSNAIERFANFTPSARKLVSALGPGGWTIIVPASAGWDSPALAGGTTVGVRIPNAPVVWEVVDALGGPVAASSANRHGDPSPTTCAAAIAGVGESCTFAIDAGPTAAALDSTVIDCSTSEPRILREGAIDRQTVARILGLSDIPVLRSVRS
jgi:L-threonylcarbamoyladenylate synthase